MTFITYAQNFEDVLLWRALGHVKNGFYIDVGANDPVLHSVTKAFYDAGWSGINIEPMPSYLQIFEQQRPRDINLGLAAGASEGEITLFDVPDVNGWATTERGVADAHRAGGHAVVEHKVPLRTLNAICAEHVDRPIHFLKIDVEGFEGEVLRGLDLQRWRPWVLVVEATLPGSRETNHDTWEGLITAHDYHYAYFDGLNRYYVAGEQRQLLDVLNLQANVFDDYISYHLDQAWKDIKTVTGVAEQAQQAHANAAAAAAHAEQLLGTAEAARQSAAERAEQAVSNCLLANEQIRQAQARADEAVWRADTAIASVNAALAAAEAAQARAADNADGRDQAQQRADQAIAASLEAIEQGRAALAQRHAEAVAVEAALRAQVAEIDASMQKHLQEAERHKLALLQEADREKQALLREADKEKQALLKAADQEKQALLLQADREKQALLAQAGEERLALQQHAAEEKQAFQDSAAAEKQAMLDSAAAEKQALLDSAAAEKQALLDNADAEKRALLANAEKEKRALLANADVEKQALLDAAERERQAITASAEQQKQALEQSAAHERDALHAAIATANAAHDASQANVAALLARQADLEQQLSELHGHAHNIDVARHQLGQWANDMQTRLLAIESSRIWRYTNPLRLLGDLLKRRAPALVRAPRALRTRSRDGTRLVLRRLTSSESARRLLMPLRRRFPNAAEKVLRMGRGQSTPPVVEVAHAAHLAQIAQQIQDAHLAQAQHDDTGTPAPVLHPALTTDLTALPQSARAVLIDLFQAMQSSSR